MAAESILKKFVIAWGLKGDKGSVSDFTRQLGSIQSLAREVGITLGAGVLLRGLDQFIESSKAAAFELRQTALGLNATTDELQEFQFVGATAGVSADAMASALGSLQGKAREAALGNAQAAFAFSRLGIQLTDSSGHFRSSSALMADLADGLRNIQDPYQRVAIVQNLFGESGRRLLPVLQQGSKGIAELREQSRRLGGGISQETIDASNALTQSQVALGRVNQSLGDEIAKRLIPIYTQWTKSSVDVRAKLLDITRTSKLAEAGLIALGIAAGALAVRFVVAFAGPLVTLATLAALIGVTWLAIDEVLTSLAGGDSLGMDFAKWAQEFSKLEAIVGEDRPLMKGLRLLVNLLLKPVEAVAELSVAMENLNAQGKSLLSIFDGLAEKKNEFLNGALGAAKTLGAEASSAAASAGSAGSGAYGSLKNFVGAIMPDFLLSGPPAGAPVDASIHVNVSVQGSDANPNDIADVISNRLQQEREDQHRKVMQTLVPAGSR